MNTTNSQTYLGFDHGEKKIGIAIGQTLTQTASPIDIIKAQDGIPNWQQIQQIIDQWQPDGFVVGLPITEKEAGYEVEVMRRAKKFGNRLQSKFNKPCHFINENYTSSEARQLNRSKRTQVDNISACLILETWFNSGSINE